jgi:hypothetical protein
MVRRGPARMAARRMAARMAARMRRRRRRRRVVLVGGLIAVGVHKFSKRDADQIEEHTGLPPEDLEDADLQQAMAELGIESQPLTPEEQAMVEGDAGDAGAAESSAAPAATGGSDLASDLERLAELHAKGILTDEEFEAKKKQILGL